MEEKSYPPPSSPSRQRTVSRRNSDPSASLSPRRSRNLRRIFSSPYTDEVIPHAMYSMEHVLNDNNLFTRDLTRMITDYALYNPEQHTVDYAIETNNMDLLKFLIDDMNIVDIVKNNDVNALKAYIAYYKVDDENDLGRILGGRF